MSTVVTATSTDWEARFRAPRTAWVQIAGGRPERGLVCTNRTGVYQLHAWDVDSGALRALTDEPTGRTAGFLSPDGRRVVWLQDAAGNELGHLVAVPLEGGAPVDLTPDRRPYTSYNAAFAPDGGLLVAAAIDAAGTRLLAIPWGTGGPAGALKEFDAGVGFVTALAIDRPMADGRRCIAYATTAERGLSTLVRIVDAATGDLIREVDHGSATVATVAFDPAGSHRLLLSTTRSGALRPHLVAADGTERAFELSSVPGDLGPQDWTADGTAAILVGSDRAAEQLHVLDLDSGTVHALGIHGSYSAVSPGVGVLGAPDGTIVAVREDGTTLPEVVVLDARTGATTRTLISAPPVPLSVPWRSVDIPSTDGVLVQGWFATPAGTGPFPTVLDIHGGPQARETDRFFPAAQAFLDRGYAFLTLNYRGSTGFGRDYEQAIWGQPGRCELDDVVAAHGWLVGSGIADPSAVVVHGGSYGGYMTLYALGRRPDLWAAGVAYVAIADWRLLYEDGDALREYARALFRGTPEERPEAYAAASPITNVDDVHAPLLIIQGRNDARCPVRQIEMYIEAARAAGKTLEVDWFDAGHGHGAIETRIAWQRRAMDFVDGVLGRRV